MIVHEAGNDFAGEKIEDRRITKEARHIDQHFPGELVEFGLVPTQQCEIGFRGLGRRHGHSALDVALQRVRACRA